MAPATTTAVPMKPAATALTALPEAITATAMPVPSCHQPRARSAAASPRIVDPGPPRASSSGLVHSTGSAGRLNRQIPGSFLEAGTSSHTAAQPVAVSSIGGPSRLVVTPYMDRYLAASRQLLPYPPSKTNTSPSNALGHFRVAGGALPSDASPPFTLSDDVSTVLTSAIET